MDDADSLSEGVMPEDPSPPIYRLLADDLAPVGPATDFFFLSFLLRRLSRSIGRIAATTGAILVGIFVKQNYVI